MGCKGVIVGKFVGVVTVCGLVGESKCALERVEAKGLAASAGFLRVCLLVCGGSGDGWRARRTQNFQLLGDLCVVSARMVEGVERFGEVAQQDAERFLIEYRWVRRACGSFEGRCVAERTGVDRCGLDQVGTWWVVPARNQVAMSFLMGLRRRFWARTKLPRVGAAVRRTTQPV